MLELPSVIIPKRVHKFIRKFERRDSISNFLFSETRCMTNSLVDDVVGVVGVSDGVGASQQHLERNVGDQLTQFC